MSFDAEAFYNFVVENKAVGFFEEPITLKSGRKSSWYVNWRVPTSDTFLMDQLTDHILAFTKSKGLNPDIFYGVPEGASKTGVVATYKWAKEQKNFAPHSHALSIGRAKPKEHGAARDRLFVGPPKGKVLVLEDTTTTGLSLGKTLELLKEQEVEVIGVLVLTHRQQKRDDGTTVAEFLKEGFGVPFYFMSGAENLLPRLNPSDDIKAAIKKEFEDVGEISIDL